MANVTKPIVLDETLKETNRILNKAWIHGDILVSISRDWTVANDGSETYGDPIPFDAFLEAVENETFNTVGAVVKMTNAFNGNPLRCVVIGKKHDVLAETDEGGLEPSGTKAKLTFHVIDIPFRKVGLGLPMDTSGVTGHLRVNENSDTDINDCREIQIYESAPSNMGGYPTAVGLRQAEQAFFDGLHPKLQAAIKVVRKDIFISRMSDGDNYETFDSTATCIAFESDRYMSQVYTKVFSLSATEVGIIPNPSDNGADHFPYSCVDNEGNDAMLEGTKYEYFNETYPYTSENQNDRRRPRFSNGELYYYWLRSPSLDISNSWGKVDIDGSVNYYSTFNDGGVAPAFCI